MLHSETISFSWDTPEYKFKKKRKDWYWIVGAATIALIILAIVLENYLFAFFIGIGGFLMIYLASKEPLSLPIEISEHGIKVYKETYSYDSIFNFWIKNKNGEKILLLLTDRQVSPMISLKIDENINPLELREYLLEFIDEQELKESITDRIIHAIGF